MSLQGQVALKTGTSIWPRGEGEHLLSQWLSCRANTGSKMDDSSKFQVFSVTVWRRLQGELFVFVWAISNRWWGHTFLINSLPFLLKLKIVTKMYFTSCSRGYYSFQIKGGHTQRWSEATPSFGVGSWWCWWDGRWCRDGTQTSCTKKHELTLCACSLVPVITKSEISKCRKRNLVLISPNNANFPF